VPAPGPGTRIRVEIPATSPMSTLTQNLHGPSTGSTGRLS
jgi:hypothetical protein